MWLWVNPRSEPEEMVDSIDRVTSSIGDQGLDEDIEEAADCDVGFEIAKRYNQAEAIGVYPKQTTPNAKPYFRR